MELPITSIRTAPVSVGGKVETTDFLQLLACEKIRRLRSVVFLLLGILIFGGAFTLLPARANAAATNEYAVKAVFLFNFAKFVEWPAESFSAADAPIVIGVLGKDRFGESLKNAIKGRTIEDRSIVIKHFSSLDQVKGCHILFISSSEKSKNAEVIMMFRKRNVLTVGETRKFARKGGLVSFVEKDKKIRFEINEDAVKTAGLKVSSRLLKLATIVKTER